MNFYLKIAKLMVWLYINRCYDRFSEEFRHSQTGITIWCAIAQVERLFFQTGNIMTEP